MKRIISTITSNLCFAGFVVFDVNAIAETPVLPLPTEPKHGLQAPVKHALVVGRTVAVHPARGKTIIAFTRGLPKRA